MAKYTYYGQEYEAPDDMPLDQVVQVINHSISQQEATPSPTPAGSTTTTEGATQPSPKSYDPNTLHADPAFLKSAGTYYRAQKGPTAPELKPQELVDFALNEMSWFNYNLPNMAVDAYRIGQADPEVKKAFLHLLDTHDNLQYSWAGAGRFLKAAAMDPTNWTGIASLGVGLAAKTGSQVVTKEGMKAALRAGIVAGIDTGIAMGAASAVRQTAEIRADGRKEMDYGKVATDTAIGMAVGGALGFGATKFSSWVGSRGKTAAGRAADVDLPAINPAIPDAAQATAESAAKAATEAVQPAVAPVATQVAEGAAKAVPDAAKAVADGPAGNPVLEAIRKVAQDTGLREVHRTRGSLNDASKEALDALLKISPKQIEELRRAPVTGEQGQMLKGVIGEGAQQLIETTALLRKAADEEIDPAARALMEINLRKLEQARDLIRKADSAFGSLQGTELANRVGRFNVKDNWDKNALDILTKQGVDPVQATLEQWKAAQDTVYEAFTRYTKLAEESDHVQLLNSKLNEAVEKHDWTNALLWMKERQTHVDNLIELQAAQDGMKVREGIGHTAMRGATEVVISSVFSPSTLVANTLPSAAKTIYKPALDALVRGGDAVAARQMTATYGAMASSVSGAFRAARLAFDVEKAILSNVGRLEGAYDPVIPRWMGGRIIRFFPRMVNAIDEFFTQIHYRGFVAGNAAGEAMEMAASRGLKGEKLDKFVQKYIDSALKNAFDRKIDAPKVVDFLRKQGALKGLAGAKLDDFIIQHLKRNGDLFQEALSQSGKDFADDILFKRAFSQQTSISRAAALYEKTVNEWPIMRLFGQLFFRTPVRVFEEGFRMTPGLNLVSPKFFKDLRGYNGEAAQVRALGEAMLGQAIAGSVFLWYAQGRITGGGPRDRDQARTLEDSKKWENYTLRFNDGSTFNFRNFDPLALPIKVMVNVLDRMAVVAKREAQGENVDQEVKRLEQQIGSVTGAIVGAVRDANLTQGISEVSKFFEALGDPDKKDTALSKFVGQKLSMFIPSTYKKVQGMDDDPVRNDPVTIEQHLRVAINPDDPKVAKQYNALGMVREVDNPMSALTGFNYTTPEMRTKGMTEKQQRVLENLAVLSQLTNQKFIPPHKVDMPGWEGKDLRTIMTADGKTTLYDRWQEYVRRSSLTDNLDMLFRIAGEKWIGTPAAKGPVATEAGKLISEARRNAFLQMIRDDATMMQQYRGGMQTQVPLMQMGKTPVPFIGGQ